MSRALQLLRPDATIIFPKGDSIPVADSAAAMPTAALSSTAAVVLVLLIAFAILYVTGLIVWALD